MNSLSNWFYQQSMNDKKGRFGRNKIQKQNVGQKYSKSLKSKLLLDTGLDKTTILLG